MKHGDTFEHGGKVWTVIGVGATNAAGQTYLHLASTTEFVEQRNGRRPVMQADWFTLPPAAPASKP